MKTYKATFITVLKQYKTVEVPDEVAKVEEDINKVVYAKLLSYGADNEAVINTSLAVLEDVTPPEEHGPGNYADWYVESGAIYFRSNKTQKDYQIMRLNSAGNDKTVTYRYAIVEMFDEAQCLKAYGKVIDTFALPAAEYLPDFNKQYNEYISIAIQKYENGVADGQ